MSPESLDAFGNAVSGVLTIFCVGLVGYLLARGKKIAPQTAQGLPKFITTIILPPYLCRSILVIFERDQLLELVYGFFIPVVSMSLCFLAALLLIPLLGIARDRKGTFIAAFATSSTLNIGLPISIALFGEAALPYTLLYFMVNSVFFWTLGNYCIALDGAHGAVRLFSLASLRKIVSPPLVGVLCGIVLVLAGWHLPDFVDKTFKYVGDLAIGLSIMYVGMMLGGIRFVDLRLSRDVTMVMAGRFLIAPLVIVGLALLIPIPTLMRDVFVIQSSLPVMMNVAILAGAYGADIKYASLLTSLSTLVCLITVPIYMVLLATV